MSQSKPVLRPVNLGERPTPSPVICKTWNQVFLGQPLLLLLGLVLLSTPALALSRSHLGSRHSPNIAQVPPASRLASAEHLWQQGTPTAQLRAIKTWQAVLAQWQQTGQRLEMAQTLQRLGSAYHDLGATQPAIAQYQQALNLYQDLNQPRRAAITLRAMGTTYAQEADQQQEHLFLLQRHLHSQQAATLAKHHQAQTKAHKHFDQALKRFEQLHTDQDDREIRREMARTLNHKGQLYNFVHEASAASDAEALFTQALQLAQQSDDHEQAAWAWQSLGQTYGTWNRKAKTWQAFEQSLESSRARGDRKSEARTLWAMGQVHHLHFGNPEAALAHYRQSLAIAKTTQDHPQIILALQAIGARLFDLGQTEQALDHDQQALQLAYQLGHRPTIVQTLRKSRLFHRDFAKSERHLVAIHQASETFLQASQFYQEVGDLTKAQEFQLLRVEQLLALGAEYFGRDRQPQAEETFDQARAYFQHQGDISGEGQLLQDISAIFRHRFADPVQQLNWLRQAQHVYQQSQQDVHRRAEADLLAMEIAPLLRYQLNNPQQAAIAYRQAVRRYQHLQEYGQAAFRLGYALADVYKALGDTQQQEAVYREALVAYRQAGNLKLESDFRIELGRNYYESGQRQQALDMLQQAHQIFATISPDAAPQQAKALVLIGQTLEQLQNPKQAIAFYRQAVPIFAQLNDAKGQAQTLVTMGRLYLTLEQPRAAAKRYRQATAVYEHSGDRNLVAWTLSQIARAYGQHGEFATGLAYYQQVLAIHQDQNNRRLMIKTLLNMGQLQAYAGDAVAGLRFCDRALRLAQQHLHRISTSRTFVTIGQLCHTLGGQQQAQAAFQAYRALYVHEPNQEANALLRLGTYYAEIGVWDQVLSSFAEARTVYQTIGDRVEEAVVLRRMGTQYLQLGNVQQADAIYQDALSTAQRAGDRRLQALVARDLGQLYRQLGDYPQALVWFERSQQQFLGLRDRKQAFRTLGERATTHHQAGQLDQALRLSQTALQTAATLGDQENAALNHRLRIGQIQRQQGHTTFALQTFQAALAFAQQHQSLRQGQIFLALGDTHLALQHPQQARQHFEQSLIWSQRRSADNAPAHLGLAKAQRALGNLGEALSQIKLAIAQIETQRIRKRTPADRQQFFANQQEYYEFYIDLLMELHQQDTSQGFDAEAFHASEQRRARSLVDLLSEAHTDIRKGVDPVLVGQERHLQAQLDRVEARRTALYRDPATPAASKREIDQERQFLLQRYQTIQAQIRAKSPSYAALTQPQPLTVQHIQSQILDSDTLLLQYALGKHHSYVWAITTDQVYSYRLPARAVLEKEAKVLYRRWQNPSTHFIRGRISLIQRATVATGNPLSQILLKPVAAHLTKKRVVVVSDGALSYLPFAALSTPESVTQKQPVPLIQRHEVVHLPSASALAILRRDARDRKPAPKTLAIFADPVFAQTDQRVKTGNRDRTWSQYLLSRAAQTIDVGVWQRLPGTRQEAEAILALVGERDRTAAFDFEANRSTVHTTPLNQYRMVHFATHGLLNSAQPELSGIILSMVNRQGQAINGFLRLHDVFNLDLSADLVVLSACQTGLGQQVEGEGLVGLTRGFMYAGTPRVLVSLWNVDDVATAELMSRFYRAMLKDGHSATAALRVAQLEMQTETQWQAPYYWAAFTVQGDWQ